MGVLGWLPQAVMQEAEMDDLADAYEGYVRFHAAPPAAPAHPPPPFLAEMMRKFPDNKEE